MDAEGAFTHGAEIPIALLDPEDREQVLRVFDRMAALPREQWEANGAQRVDSDLEAYVFNVNPDLFGYFSLDEAGRPVLEHVFRPETLNQYFQYQNRRKRLADEE